MRSFTLKAALAAILVSTSLAGAYAAAADHDRSGPATGAQSKADAKAEWDHTQNFDAQTTTAPDTMTTGSIAKPMTPTAPAGQMAVRHAEYRPRLDHIVRELGAANHRMRVDHGRGYLTQAEFRRLQARSHDIRREAMRSAGNHDGALPRASYVALQDRITRLNHEIHRAATT